MVTGGAGFIGSELAARLVENPENEVIVVDNLLTGSMNRLPQSRYDNLRFIKADVNVLSEILPIMVSHRFDYVFHYAAVVGVQRTLQNPVMVLNDIQGIKNVLDLCKSTGVRRVFFSSSSEVYGEPVEFPQNELTTPLNSKLPYAVVKNVGESFCRSYRKEFGLEYTIFRFFNTYGPRQSTDFVISRFIRKALANEPIPVYGDGSQTRTFCYIDDNIEACLACLERDVYVNEVVNIGNEVEISIAELAQTVIKVTNSRSGIRQMPALEEGDMQRRMPDIDKMCNLLDRPLVNLTEGLQRVLASPAFLNATARQDMLV